MADDAPLPRSKPPFLRRVRIRGYKSIEYCNVTLEPLTVLVGRNGAGKSNFLDALGFLRDLVEESVTAALGRRNGWSAVVYRQDSYNPAIEFEIEVTVDGRTGLHDVAYQFQLGLGDHRFPQVQHERLELRGGSGDIRGYTRTPSGVEWLGPLGVVGRPGVAGVEQRTDGSVTLRSEYALNRPRPDRLVLGMIGLTPFDEFADGLRLAHVYDPVPDLIRRPQPIAPDLGLTSDAANLARVIADLNEFDPEHFSRVVNYLSVIVPEVQNVWSVRRGEYETIQFKTGRGGDRPSVMHDAHAMSDGTLRALAVLAAVWQVYFTHTDAGFVGFEEPETALHPAAVHALVDALDEATLRTQVLFTTHSPDLLDCPAVGPENVRVVEMIDGRTVIAPVDAAGVELVRRKLNTLGGLEREGQLAPDMTDVHRQRREAGASPA